MRQIARDPFARATLVRRNSPQGSGAECGWCGTKCKTPFEYAQVPDSVRPAHLSWSRAFCSVGCYRSHHA